MKTWKAHTEILSKAKNLSDCVARLLTYLPFYLTVVTAILVSTVIYSILFFEENLEKTVFIVLLSITAAIILAWASGVKSVKDSESSKLLAAIDEANEGVLITSVDGQFIYSNEAFYQLFCLPEKTKRQKISSLNDFT